MGDLRAILEELEPPRDDACLPLRQHASEPVLARVKEGQRQKTALVTQEHAVGLPAGGTGLMAVDDTGDGHDLAGHGGGDRRSASAVDEACRQVPQKVDHAAAARDPLEERTIARADAGQSGDVGKERVKTLRAHAPTLPSSGRL